MPPRSRYLLRGLIWLGIGLITYGGRDWLRARWEDPAGSRFAVSAAYLIFYVVEGRRAAVPGEAPASGSDQTP
jgi:hypothetical protein